MTESTPPADPSAGWSFETKQIHAGQHPTRPPTPGPCRSTRPPPTSSRHRPRRDAVRAGGVRQHLHPDHEPDPRRRWSSGSPALEGGVAALLLASGPGGGDAGHPEHRRRRRRYRLQPPASTAAPTTSSTTRCPSSGSRSPSSKTPTTSTSGVRRSGRTPRPSTPRPSSNPQNRHPRYRGYRRGRA